MFCLASDTEPGRLLDPVLRADLAAVGATRVQVNVDDADVAPAMRIAHADPPVGAVLTVWTGDDARPPAPVIEVLTPLTDRLWGYEVHQRAPLPPPAVADGERAPCLAGMALLRRPADLEHREWLRRWLDDHTPVAIATQSTFGYLQNVVVRPVTADAAPVAAIVEELFPSEAMTDPHAFYGSDGDEAELRRRIDAMLTSVSRFGADRDLDLVPTSRYEFDLSSQ